MDEQVKSKILEWKFILPLLRVEAKVGKCDNLTFEVRTKENGHNKPHIHVSTSAASLSIAIETGEILAQSGSIRERNIEKARDWIFQNQNFLKAKWNELANCPIKFSI